VQTEVRDGIVPASGRIAQTADHHGGEAANPNFRTVALIVACALFMEHLDATVLATALPTMARDFGVRATEMSVALTAYLLALAIFIPASGVVADRFGSRTVFQAAIALFIASSVACGLAPSLPVMVVARFFQGSAGAMMIPVGRLVLLRSVAKADLVTAMQWLLMPALVGPILGPPLGGWIVTYLDWRWIFWLNVPIGCLGIALAWKFIANVREERARRFDALGFLLSSVALGSLLAGFELSTRPGSGRIGLALAALGLGAGWLYWRHAARTVDPILDLSLLKVPTFGLSLAGGSLARITQGAQPFLLPLMMQLAFGLSAAKSGTITVATTLGSFAMKGFAKPILHRFGFRTSLTVMGVVATLAYACCGFFRGNWPLPAIFAILVACGFLMSFLFTAYNTLAYDEIDKERMSAAIGFYTTFQQLMLSLGIAAGAGALHLSMAAHGRVEPGFGDFSVAFWSVTAISLAAVFVNLRFSPDAGAQMSGRSPG
jgi:EmrB/QacA subfamily drug resistance transporter